MAEYSSQPDETSGIDTFLRSNQATTNFATDNRIISGENNSVTSIQKGLIKLSLTSIPTGSKISAATLSFWVVAENSNNIRIKRVFRVKRDWVESEATWNIYSTGNNWQVAGCGGANDVEAADIGSTSIGDSPGAGDQIDFELDGALSDYAEIEAMVGTGPAFTNNGFLIKTDTEDADEIQFDSSSSVTAGERPRLAITYTPPTGGSKIFYIS